MAQKEVSIKSQRSGLEQYHLFLHMGTLVYMDFSLAFCAPIYCKIIRIDVYLPKFEVWTEGSQVPRCYLEFFYIYSLVERRCWFKIACHFCVFTFHMLQNKLWIYPHMWRNGQEEPIFSDERIDSSFDPLLSQLTFQFTRWIIQFQAKYSAQKAAHLAFYS